jgi:hypothetical protein
MRAAIESLFGLCGSLANRSRYDLLLAVLPLPLVLGMATSALVSAPVSIGAGLGGLPSAALLAYGLFYRPPTSGRPPGTRPA